MNLFKLGGSRRKSRSRKNRKSRRRRSLRGGEAGVRAGVMGPTNSNVASRRM
jgi:hypothetical protein